MVYRDVCVDIKGAGGEVEAPSLGGFFSSIATAPLRAVGLCRRNAPALPALRGVCGRLRPGTSTLVLAPPGAGASTLLRVLSARLGQSGGEVLYNGHTAAQLKASGVELRKLAAYGGESDDHEFLLTVKETLEFAHAAAVVPHEPHAGKTPGEARWTPPDTETVLAAMGLTHVQNTIVGNALGE